MQALRLMDCRDCDRIFTGCVQDRGIGLDRQLTQDLEALQADLDEPTHEIYKLLTDPPAVIDLHPRR